MINKNIIIAALARDCEDSLETNIPLIENLRKQFVWSAVIVVENDSIDATKDILNNWKSNSENVEIISNNFGTKTIPDKSDLITDPWTSYQRIEKMAAYRNLYLDYIEEIDHHIDLVIIIDIDVIKISSSGILDVIHSFDNQTGAVFSNGISIMKTPWGMSEIYYDIFALWEYPMSGEFSYTARSLNNTFKSINKKLKKSPHYNVISAFGGVGVYNYQAIKGLRYRNVLNPLNEQQAICEHITFNHAIIKRGFTNFIARDFQVIYERHNWILIMKLILPFKVFNFLYSLLQRIKR